ncbi:MAG TPA: carboxypeptidase regulatory-like domain-containing protein [Pyrinomonadaceae bacterium]|nr:carboxypeptidase regulatory-like domain-containing protein [Pyrinomonadaceae bacterium]
MNVSKNVLRQVMGTALILLLSVVVAFSQQSRGTLRGVISDELGATIVGATVTLTGPDGVDKTAVTNNDGVYSFTGLAPGKYLLRAEATGFASSEVSEVDVNAGQRATFDMTLKVTIEEQKVTIESETPISTDSNANANQTLISGKDLDALPDDPDELAAALQALAGPSAGPNGGQIFVDGFTGGRLPPKESIREIRINQNPFAAENDQPSGRIDVLTRPGTDKLRGSTFFNFQDESFNSRNPFATSSDKRSPFQVRQYGGNLGGPIVAKRASFFIDFERREIDDSELVRATILDDFLNPLELGFGVVVPRRTLTFSPRFDLQLNSSNTLIARYSFNRSTTDNNGVGGFSLPERAYVSDFTQQEVQFTETAILTATMINETRFQFSHNGSSSLGNILVPTLNVSSSFISGGSQVGKVENSNKRMDLQNFTAWQKGTHAFKFGGRLRRVSISDSNPNNFGGSYTFSGGNVPSLDANNNPIFNQPVFADSLERYRRTLLFANLSDLEIRRRGGGASQFNMSGGNPLATVSQTDYGFYAQDDWRIRPNLTLSYGLRYEGQTNIGSVMNFAPRLAVAWSPGAANSTKPPKMVIRAGGGVFYNRFNEFNTLQANRFNGENQQQFFISEVPLYDANGNFVEPNPNGSPLDAFPNRPALSSLVAQNQAITYRVADDLQAPVVYMGGTQVERQLPYKFTMFMGLFMMRIQHVIRARDINAPIPGTNGQRPFGNVGEIYQYESTGHFNMNQLFIGFNNRFSRTISFFSNYVLSKTTNDTDGQGGGMFPANSYDMSGEFGRAGFDVRHRFTFAGTINLPWQVSLNPFIIAASGRPFNITIGQDINGDRLFTERPSFAPDGVDCANPGPNIVCTAFGNFNTRPTASDTLIPRNFGQGPAFFSVNMRISKTWNFGNINSSAANQQQGQGQQAARTGGGGGAQGAPRVPGAGGGPGGGGGGGQRSGGGGLASIGGPVSGGGSEAKRYSMQFSVNFQNLFNNVNLGSPQGNLSSPFFGESTGLAPFFGGFGPGGGGGGFGGSGVGNRRVTAQVRFSF